MSSKAGNAGVVEATVGELDILDILESEVSVNTSPTAMGFSVFTTTVVNRNGTENLVIQSYRSDT